MQYQAVIHWLSLEHHIHQLLINFVTRFHDRTNETCIRISSQFFWGFCDWLVLIFSAYGQDKRNLR